MSNQLLISVINQIYFLQFLFSSITLLSAFQYISLFPAAFIFHSSLHWAWTGLSVALQTYAQCLLSRFAALSLSPLFLQKGGEQQSRATQKQNGTAAAVQWQSCSESQAKRRKNSRFTLSLLFSLPDLPGYPGGGSASYLITSLLSDTSESKTRLCQRVRPSHTPMVKAHYKPSSVFYPSSCKQTHRG